MNRIATYGSKGGSGKTTASVVLCVGLQLPLCDLDPQRSATKWLERRQLPHPLAPAGSERWVADCPPGISGEHIGVLALAALVVIPVRPSFNDLQVLPETVRFVEANCPGRIGFLLSDVDKRTSDEQIVRSLLGPFGHPIVGMFSHRVAYSRAGISGQLPGELDPVAKHEMDEVIRAVTELCE
jgi:chromosome partitioning protein